jgi:hypothetical protein
MQPWLRLIERIQDLPIQQLDQHLARTLADELGVPYQPVSAVPAMHSITSVKILLNIQYMYMHVRT